MGWCGPGSRAGACSPRLSATVHPGVPNPDRKAFDVPLDSINGVRKATARLRSMWIAGVAQSSAQPV
jgi:hypothetical protein